MANEFDLASTLTAVAQRMQAMNSEAGAINSAYGAQIGGYGSQSAAIGQGGEANKVIQQQASEGALQTQRNTQIAASALGTNMNDSSQIVTMLGDVLKRSAQDMVAAQNKVTQIESKATLGNPLGLIYDAFFGDEARAQLEGAKAQADGAARNLSNAFALTQQAYQTNKATSDNISQASEDARLKAIDADTKLKQAQVQTAAAGVNISRLQALQSQNEQQLNLAIKGYQLEAQDEQRKYMNEVREQAREDRMAAKKDDALGLELYNLGRKAQGLPEIDMPYFKTQQKLGKPEVLQTIQLGERYYGRNQADWNKIPVGVNAVDSIVNIMDMGLPIAENEKQMVGRLTQSFADAKDPKKLMSALGIDMTSAAALATDKKKTAEVAQQLIEKEAQAELAQLRPSDKSGIYKVPDLGILKDTPPMQTNPFLNRVVLPLAINNEVLDPNVLMAQAAQLVGKGELTASDVVNGFQYIGNQMAATMAETNNYSRYRLPSPVTEGFRVSISNGTGILKGSQSKIINLMDPTQVNEALARSLGTVVKLNKAAKAESGMDFFSGLSDFLDRNTFDSIREGAEYRRQHGIR